VDQLEQNIAQAAQVLDYIIREARHEREKQGIPSASLTSALKSMQEKVWVNAHWSIAWPTWPPGLWAKFTALVKKTIRQALSWYINPIVQQQNEFNRATLSTIHLLSRELIQLRKDRVQDLAELEALKRQLRDAHSGVGTGPVATPAGEIGNTNQQDK